MRLSAACMACMVSRQAEALREEPDEDRKSEYLRQVLRVIGDAPEGMSAPVVTERIGALHEAYFGRPYSFRELKRRYNALMLGLEDAIGAEIAAAEDPLRLAVQYARVGNYIDFGAMGSVDDEKLRALLDRARQDELEETTYEAWKRDLDRAQRLVYCTDNCGEIVLDKLLIRQLKKRWPQLEITVLVRGGEVLNDATREDAEEVGLTGLTQVLGNGTQVAGTDLATISPEARRVFDEADVIVSKGQGNFETLHGCGRNVYYLFLCKCDWFTQRFGLERFRGVFVNEKDHQIA